MPRSSVIVTAASVLVAVGLSIAWLVSVGGAARLEPAAQTLGLLGGAAGVVAERRASVRERRAQLLGALAEELRAAQAVLDSPRFGLGSQPPRRTVYPRLPTSAAEAALISGALLARDDAEVMRLLREWRDEATGFNRRLDLTEVCTFVTALPADLADFQQVLSRRDGYLAEIRDRLAALTACLAARHPAAAPPVAPAARHPSRLTRRRRFGRFGYPTRAAGAVCGGLTAKSMPGRRPAGSRRRRRGPGPAARPPLTSDRHSEARPSKLEPTSATANNGP
jgi:hypothetical protein